MASYFETRYLAPTNGGKGSRIRIVRAGSRSHVLTMPYDYAASCAHAAAMAHVEGTALTPAVVAFATDRGYVFRVGA
jgi:hypothetical protein